MQLQYKISNELSMLWLGKKFAQSCKYAIIFLHGELGAGKTTFVRGFLRGLGFTGTVKSPTYTLVEPYQLAGLKIFHFDLYRLQNPAELENIGIEEYFTKKTICLVEWAERGYPLLPTPDLDCKFEIVEQEREIICQAQTDTGKEILRKLNQ